MKHRNIFRFVLGFLILGILFYKVGISEVVDVIKNVDGMYLIPAVFSFLTTLIFGAGKIDLLLKSLGYKINFWKMVRYSITAWAIGTVTPSKIGEFSILYFFKNEKLNIGEGAAIALSDRIITFVSIAIFAIMGVMIYFTSTIALELSLGLMIILILGLTMIKSVQLREFIKKRILKNYTLHLKGFSKTFFLILTRRRKIMVVCILLTIIKGMIGALVAYSLFFALNTPVSYWHVFFITAMTTLLSLVPITISGLGIKEASNIYLFNLLTGIDIHTIAGVAVLSLLIKYSSAAIISFAFSSRLVSRSS